MRTDQVRGRLTEPVVEELVAALGPRTISLISVPGALPAARMAELGVARVSVGPWSQRAAMAALLYGFSGAFRIWAGGVPVGSEIPSDLIQMVPYVVTLVAVVLFVGRAIPPAAVGKPYIKE